jgi:hypothetical protein
VTSRPTHDVLGDHEVSCDSFQPATRSKATNSVSTSSSAEDSKPRFRHAPVGRQVGPLTPSRTRLGGRDVSEFLAELEPRATRHALRLRVAYHDACHLQHAQGVRSQPRALLRRIPQLQLLEIPEAAICCGSAGIYNLVQPEAATQLGDRKAAHVAALDADMVVSGNPGCLLQLQSALPRAGRKLPVDTSSSCLTRLSAAFLYDVGALPALLGSLLRL